MVWHHAQDEQQPGDFQNTSVALRLKSNEDDASCFFWVHNTKGTPSHCFHIILMSLKENLNHNGHIDRPVKYDLHLSV